MRRRLERAPASIEVRVAKAAVQPLAQTFDAGGIVKARTTAQISSRIVAELQEMRVQPGDRVRQGQILAVLDDRDLDARRSAAQASLAAAESATASAEAERESAGARLALAREHHRRIEQLREQNSATPEEQDRASAELRVAEAGMRAADARASEASASVAAAQVCDPSGRSGRLVFNDRCAVRRPHHEQASGAGKHGRSGRADSVD